MIKMGTYLFLLFCVGLLSQLSYSDAVADQCPSNATFCQLPLCRCSSSAIPGGLASKEIPQIVLITFDDPINDMNNLLYDEILSSRKNPNGANISATFFISHDYNNYGLTHQLWRKGNEIALQSISRDSNAIYWRNLNATGWKAEIVDQVDQMALLANIPREDIKGMRAPFLQGGGNLMFEALSKSDLSWECSRPTWNYRQPGLWPYTNDYRSVQDCQIPPCPDESFPGFWSVPMIDSMGLNGFPCPMLDSCQPLPETANDTFRMLQVNFQDQYDVNRAPFGIFTKSSWLQGPTPDFDERKQGYKMFLDYLATLPDVYIVSISKALAWIQQPTALQNISDFSPWKPEPLLADGCPNPLSCQYSIPSRYMRSCSGVCPLNYPWIHNPLGQ